MDKGEDVMTTSGICMVGAIILALLGIDGWGWLLFIGVLLH